MPGKMKDKVKKPNPMKMTQMRNGKMIEKSGGKKIKSKVNKNKAVVKKNRGKALMMQSQNPKIEGFQDYVKRMFGGGQS